ncbi:hypothetical protein IMG5_106430 [Ichthyophthirius multifiliis]|uniref:Uncharacterized protein n=1 Tax=Ichthyophthirius multifiliis TaxID=5932 RepID=G0QT66_ICHMU|nr:hypothetical protein IMG5_106430 [Ichthyophthirius multifiliis]EGR31591.1 hypothetical protein IMG5_106430 [Ichthyophthirius multifiliis]|eukprot:XP_004035077.1 hypothetical protein IMG5_106430 [Ichthyophthirius multifiliis]
MARKNQELLDELIPKKIGKEAILEKKRGLNRNLNGPKDDMDEFEDSFLMGVKQKIIENAQNEIQKSAGEMISEVEKLLRENEILRKESEQLKDTIVELQTQNENQNWKNSCFKKDIDQINTQFNVLKKDSSELEKFIPQYLLLHSKFPELDSKQFINKYEKLENLCLELNKKITELEEKNIMIEIEKQQIKEKFDKQIDQFRQNDTTRDKLMKLNLEKLKEKEMELRDAEEYKINYMLLQKKLQQVFIKWHSQSKEVIKNKQIFIKFLYIFYIQKVYPLGKKDNGPQAEIRDPIEMLKTMEGIVKISTADKLQEYLRKIIVSANILQRKYLPESVNEKFEPDKIYARILKLINKLNSENYKLNAQIKQLKRENESYEGGENKKTEVNSNDNSYIQKSLSKFHDN